MTKNYKFEKSFGPIGSSAGILMFFVGLFATFNSFYALFLMVFGAFLGFTTQRTKIDFDQKKIKYSTVLFGFIGTGQWIMIESTMKMSIKKSKKVWRSYSRSNRVLDVDQESLQIILCDSAGKLIMPIKNIASPEAAKLEIERLSEQLGISRI